MPPRFFLVLLGLTVLTLAVMLHPISASRLEVEGGVRVVYTRPEVVIIESNGSDAYGGGFVARRATLSVNESGSVTDCIVGVYCYRGGLLGALCIAAVNVTLYDDEGNVLAYNTSAALVLAGRYANVTVPFDGTVKIGDVYAVVVEALG